MCLIKSLAMVWVLSRSRWMMPLECGHCDRSQVPSPGAGGGADAMDVIATSHRPAELWRRVLQEVQDAIQRLGAHPSRVVVLLPYAQLMPLARRAWALLHPQGFAPRFE